MLDYFKLRDELAENVLLYGYVKADVETEEADGFRRIRVVDLDGKKYFHHMFNGKVIDCFEV